MRVKLFLSILFTCAFSQAYLSAQTIPKEELIFLTSEWKGDRFPDGRPKIAEKVDQYHIQQIINESLTRTERPGQSRNEGISGERVAQLVEDKIRKQQQT